MNDKSTDLSTESLLDAVLEDIAANTRIKCSEDVVEKIAVGIGVNNAGKGKLGFLSTAVIVSLFTHLRSQAMWEVFQVSVERGGLNGLLELLHVKRTAEENVFLDRVGLDPSLLGTVYDSAIAVDFARYAHHLSNNCRQERALSRSDITDDCKENEPLVIVIA